MDYPFNEGSNLYPPNPADQRNNQSTSWLQLDNVWAPGLSFCEISLKFRRKSKCPIWISTLLD